MAKKVDDTNEIPEKITAPWLKRFFKAKFGITVRINTSAGRNPYIDAWIQSIGGLHELKYDKLFPAELGNMCMGVVYKSHPSLAAQNWGGNIRDNSIAMHDAEWRLVLSQIIESQVNA